MFDLRILNLISAVLLLVAFCIAVAKLDKSRDLNNELETALQERVNDSNQDAAERAFRLNVETAKQMMEK